MLTANATPQGYMTKTKIQTVVDISKEYEISVIKSEDVLYLRSRNRWTKELELSLIKHIKEGIPYNLMEFGVTKETQQRLIDDAMYSIRFRNRMPHLIRSAAVLKNKGAVTTEIYCGANGNYRVLMNGLVHPLWCGFETETSAKETVSFCFD